MERKPKRSFQEIRNILLLQLYREKKTINKLASDSNINWRTTELHLNYLVGRGLVREVFSSPYARIYEITEKGKEVVERMNQNGLLKFVKDKKQGRILII